jgi:hypothetical protein
MLQNETRKNIVKDLIMLKIHTLKNLPKKLP